MTKQEKIEKIAEACHEMNRTLCAYATPEMPGVAWGDAPDWQRESCADGVRFHLENPDAGPSASHEQWLAHKEADGWRYGPTKDPKKKEHPCFVPFCELPVEQQAKDVVFRATVHAVAAALATDCVIAS